MVDDAGLLHCPFCGPGNSAVSFFYDDVSDGRRAGSGFTEVEDPRDA